MTFLTLPGRFSYPGPLVFKPFPGHLLFDAPEFLFGLALGSAFGQGQPLPCAPVFALQMGKFWSLARMID
jgi:hypothetical protein